MEQAKMAQKSLNEGLWLRAAFMKGSRTETVWISCPLKFLSPLFSAHMYLPTRSIMSLSLSMRNDSQLLCVASTDKEKYKLEVKDIFLNLKYATYHDQVKDRWETAIDANGLRRNVQCDRTSYFVMKEKSTSARFQSIFSFSVTPCVLICYFLTEKTFIGNYSANRYSFQNPGVKSIQIFKNSIGHSENSNTTSMNIKKNSKHHLYWYKQFLSVFGSPSHDIQPDQFLDDMFLMCWNMTVSPTVENEPLIGLDSQNLRLSPIDAGSIDVTIELENATTENLVVFFLGFFQQEIVFDKNGVPDMS